MFRAIETDRYVLRAANTGISSIIDPRGRIEGKTPIFTEEVLRGTYALKEYKNLLRPPRGLFRRNMPGFLVVVVVAGLVRKEA